MRYGSRVSYAFVRENVCIQSWMLLYSFESCLQRAENFTPTNFNKVFKFVKLSLFGMMSFSSISFKRWLKLLRDWSKSIGGVGRSREGVGHEVLSLVQGVGQAIFSYP